MAFRIIIVTFAILLDLFEMIIEAAMTAFGATAAGLGGGCAAGAAVAGKVGCTIGGLLGGLLGILSEGTGTGEVAGAILGYVLDVALTLSLGVLLVSFLLFSGKLNSWGKWLYTIGLFVLKIIPFIGLAPGWTKYAWDCTDNVASNVEAARATADAVTEGRVSKYITSPQAQKRQMRDIEFYKFGSPESYEQAA